MTDSRCFLPFKSEGRIPTKPIIIETGNFLILSPPQKKIYTNQSVYVGKGPELTGKKVGEKGG